MATFQTYDRPVLIEAARGSDIRAYVAEEAVSQGQLVREGGTNSDEVEPSAADGERVVGIALYDAAAGATVAVCEGGARVRFTSGTGTVAAGDPLASHGTTTEGSVDTAASGDYIVGVASKADDGSNAYVEGKIDPEGFVYGGSPS